MKEGQKKSPHYENLGERRTNTALELLKKELPEIAHFHWSVRDGEIDILHTDFLIFLKCGMALPLQVKMTEKSAKKHIKKYPWIPAIVVNKRTRIGEIAQKIKDLIIEHNCSTKELLSPE